jgi:hypothetical protein
MVETMSLIGNGLPRSMLSFVGVHSMGKVPVIVGKLAEGGAKEAFSPALSVTPPISGFVVLGGCAPGAAGANAVCDGASPFTAGGPALGPAGGPCEMAVTSSTGRSTEIGTLC